MAKKRFKAELFASKYSEAVGTDEFKALTAGMDEAGVKAISHIITIVPLLGFLLPAAMSIFQGGVGQLHSQDGAKVFQPSRLPPEVIIKLWRRGLLDDVGLPDAFADMADQGWSEERVNAIVKSTEAIPTPQDAVNFLAHEVMEPDMVKKYGLDNEWDKVDKTLFAEIGVPEKYAKMYWLNHWQHPSYGQVIEFRRRELITDADIWEWFKLVEIPPHWRDKLIELVWEIPTRVDVRRWLDMGTIDEARLRELYGSMGYHGKNLDDYVLWTKVYNAFPDLVARFKNGYISAADVKAELVSFGMEPTRADELLETKIKKLAPERLVKERDLTLTQIYKGVKADKIDRSKASRLIEGMGYDDVEAALLLELYAPPDNDDKVVEARILSKADIRAGLKTEAMQPPEALQRLSDLRYTASDAGLLLRIFQAQINPPEAVKSRELTRADITAGVKKGLLSPKEGFEALLDMDFSAADAEYILLLKAEESPFSPVNPSEFDKLVNQYRQAVGVDYHERTEAALMAEKSVIEAKARLQAARERGAERYEIVMFESLVQEAEIKFDGALIEAGE